MLDPELRSIVSQNCQGIFDPVPEKDQRVILDCTVSRELTLSSGRGSSLGNLISFAAFSRVGRCGRCRSLWHSFSGLTRYPRAASHRNGFYENHE